MTNPARDDGKNDPVDHPTHYRGHPSGIEAIQITEWMNFCIGNAMKYLWRADEKGNAVEDLKKAAWYINREIERRTLQEEVPEPLKPLVVHNTLSVEDAEKLKAEFKFALKKQALKKQALWIDPDHSAARRLRENDRKLCGSCDAGLPTNCTCPEEDCAECALHGDQCKVHGVLLVKLADKVAVTQEELEGPEPICKEVGYCCGCPCDEHPVGKPWGWNYEAWNEHCAKHHQPHTHTYDDAVAENSGE